jgi:hypothetical protein
MCNSALSEYSGKLARWHASTEIERLVQQCMKGGVLACGESPGNSIEVEGQRGVAISSRFVRNIICMNLNPRNTRHLRHERVLARRSLLPLYRTPQVYHLHLGRFCVRTLETEHDEY